MGRKSSKIRSRCLRFIGGQFDKLLEENLEISEISKKRYPSRDSNKAQRFQKWINLVSSDRVGVAIRDMKGEKKAIIDDANVPVLEKMFPKAELCTKPSDLAEMEIDAFSNETVLLAIRKQKQRSAGLSHLNGSLLLQLVEASPSLLTEITYRTNLIAAGKNSDSLADFPNRGITVEKPGGFRPIVICDIFDSTPDKCFMLTQKKEFQKVIREVNPHQKALEPRGCEIIIHGVRSFVDDNIDNPDAAIALEDLEKCFQNLKRESWLPQFHHKLPMLSPLLHKQYTKAGKIMFDGHLVECTEGFGQGDSKGPLGCCLATANSTMASVEFLKKDTSDWITFSFLDDVTKGSTEVNLCNSVNYTILNGPKTGEFVNRSKTLIVPVSVLHGRPAPPPPANFPAGVTRVTNGNGIEIGKPEKSGIRELGSYLGTKEYCTQALLDRLKKTESMYKKFDDIGHSHVVKHLMDRLSVMSGFTHIYRTTPPDLITGAYDQIENVQRSLFEKSIVGHKLTDLQWSIAQLPYSMGGWNLVPPKVLSICGFLASLASCRDQILESRPQAKDWIEKNLTRATVLLQTLTNSAKPIEITSLTKQRDLVHLVMKDRFDHLLSTAPEDIRVLLRGESMPHAYAWKVAPPQSRFFMNPVEFRFCVRRSLRVLIFPQAFLCPEHKQGERFDINVFGDHCLHCMPGGGVVHRHDDTYREFVRSSRQALLSCSTEVTETFANGSTYRADIVMTQPIPGLTTQKVALDFTLTNNFAPTYFNQAAKTSGYAIDKGIERKLKEVNVEELKLKGYDFKILSFESTGGCNADTEKLVNYILSENALVHNKPFSELVSEFWTVISVLIQRSNAQMICKRLPQNEQLMF